MMMGRKGSDMLSEISEDRLLVLIAQPGLMIRLRALFDWWGPVWQPTGALAAALLLGVMLGLANPDTSAALADMTGQYVSTDTTDTSSPFDAFLLGSEDSL